MLWKYILHLTQFFDKFPDEEIRGGDTLEEFGMELKKKTLSSLSLFFRFCLCNDGT